MDSRAIDINCRYLGVSTLQLMENAGKEIASHVTGKKVAVFCGTGNNGGDGFVAARHLSSMGKSVKVYFIKGERKGSSRKNLDILQRMNVPLEAIGDKVDDEKIKNELEEFDFIIDALLGTGVEGELREPIKTLVRVINSAKAKRLSVDVPTGDRKTKVIANAVVSLHKSKFHNAKVVNIGIPKEAELYCGPGDLYPALPKRRGKEHKGDFGRVLVLGGSKNYIGTPYLVGASAMKTGTDIVIIACPRYVARKMRFDPNLIIQPLDSEFYIREDDIETILKQRFDVMAVGNGLSLEEETRAAVRRLLREVTQPMVIDADALKLIRQRDIKPNMILTPHKFEFETLFGKLKNEVKDVEKYAKRTKSVIVLKGGVDIISDGRTTRFNRTGNPYMTVGGTGDTLAGIISGLLAQNRDGFQSACAGTFLNGLAGDIAAKELKQSLTATDLIARIPDAIKMSEEYFD